MRTSATWNGRAAVALAAAMGVVAVAGVGYRRRVRAARTAAERQRARRLVDPRPRVAERPDGSLAIRNPVVETGADPFVAALDDGRYLYVYSDHDAIRGKVSDDIYDWDARPVAWLWSDPSPAADRLQGYWAPEVHRVRGEWVVYFAANRGEALWRGRHRTHVLRAIDNDPRRGFAYRGNLALAPDAFAIDATPLALGDDLYLVYSGTRAAGKLNQALYLTRMADAYTPVGERVRIAEPTFPWELRGRRMGLWPSINEGPQVIERNGRVFVLFSASGSWSDHYCLGLLELRDRSRPMAREAWYKFPEPAFASANGVLAPGHASTVHYRGRDYLLYHAAKYVGAGWDREVHLKAFGFDGEGVPRFGQPEARA